jgi:hypothetical protein
MACDLANDFAQAQLECGPEEEEDWHHMDDYYEEPDTSGPVHSNKDAICCYCGSDKEPDTGYDDNGEVIFDGVFYPCECRSIANDCNTLEDDDLPF